MISLKLKASCENNIDYAQESLMDQVAWLFTSDKSISEKIGNMLYSLQDLNEDQIKALESTHIDFKMQTFQNTQKLMAFSGQAIEFVVANCKKYEGKSYALLEHDREEIESEVDSAYSSFVNSHDVDEILRLLKEDTSVGDKTYANLGFTYNNLITLTKEFKEGQAGKLGRMRKMKFISECVAVTPEKFQLKVVHEAAAKFAKLLGIGIDVYKYVDKFLFFTYRKLEKNGLIKS